ncbi:hypothetical protein N8T08_006526 [Aspergillus melleus]|uniref:Uncharacterized protein n=1 Tax=Aspergillus melleus TaxID=138277 RepID=A0ACC3BEN4_9EURO|nr:hypothetical protein N8T08_006526 [Aspergillus melleus]
MQYKTLSLLALSATALAAPSPQKNTELEELPNYEEVSSVAPAASETDVGFDLAAVGIPTSVVNVLETAMPLSFITSLADPSFASKVDQDWESGKYPEWYSSLPSGVKDYMNSVASEFGEASTIPANTALATDNTGKSTTADSASASATATATATATDTKGASSSAAHASNSQTTGSQTSGSQTTGSSSASGSSSAAETTGSQGATSEGGAPAPTGAMAASLAGAAGIIGLAFAL